MGWRAVPYFLILRNLVTMRNVWRDYKHSVPRQHGLGRSPLSVILRTAMTMKSVWKHYRHSIARQPGLARSAVFVILRFLATARESGNMSDTV